MTNRHTAQDIFGNNKPHFRGLTEIAGLDIDGRVKRRGWASQDWTLQDWTMTDGYGQLIVISLR